MTKNDKAFAYSIIQFKNINNKHILIGCNPLSYYGKQEYIDEILQQETCDKMDMYDSIEMIFNQRLYKNIVISNDNTLNIVHKNYIIFKYDADTNEYIPLSLNTPSKDQSHFTTNIIDDGYVTHGAPQCEYKITEYTHTLDSLLHFIFKLVTINTTIYIKLY
jgi:hypothetical protein